MTEPRMTGTKFCSDCKNDLPVICFAVDKKTSDGLHHRCRECKRKYNINKSKSLDIRRADGRSIQNIPVNLRKDL